MSSDLKHHVALSPHEEGWSGETFSAKRTPSHLPEVSPSFSLATCARSRRALQPRTARPCGDGRLRAGPEHRGGLPCGGGRERLEAGEEGRGAAALKPGGGRR